MVVGGGRGIVVPSSTIPARCSDLACATDAPFCFHLLFVHHPLTPRTPACSSTRFAWLAVCMHAGMRFAFTFFELVSACACVSMSACARVPVIICGGVGTWKGA